MQLHKLSMLLGLVLLLAPGAARAADVAVFPVESTNLHPADAAAIGELLAQAYAAASSQAVLTPPRTLEALGQSSSHHEAAQRLGVREYLRSNAVASGHKIVVQAMRYQVDGLAVHHESLVADSMDDMITVTQRLALALHRRTSDEEVRTYRNVTLTETRPQNRVWTEKLWGFKAGVHLPFARDASYAAAASVGLDFRLEHQLFFLEFGASLIIPTDMESNPDDCSFSERPECEAKRKRKHGSVGGLGAEIGASRFLTRGDVGLYAGGGLSPRLGIEDGRDAVMVFAYGQLGVMLPRDASARFYADVRLAQSLAPSRLDNGFKRFPTEPALHVGAAW
jgi:hypothetical protein